MIVDFLELLNKVARLNIPDYQDFTPINNVEVMFRDTELDSLGVILVTMYIAEIYGIPENVSKEFNPAAVCDLISFVENHKTRSPESVEEAMGWI
jgi:acyl carrier protein